jgi:hypothetical protein
MYNEPGSRKPLRHKDGSITYFDKEGNTFTQRRDGTFFEGYNQRGGGQIRFEEGRYAGSVDRQHNGDYVERDHNGQEVSRSTLQDDGSYRTITQAEIKQRVDLLNSVLGFNRRERKRKAKDQAEAAAHYAAAEARLFPNGNPARRAQAAAAPVAAPEARVRMLHVLGVVAFVMGLSNVVLWATGIIPLATVILSIIAIKNFDSRVHKGRAFALLGLVFGLIACIGVALVLIASMTRHY